MEFEKARKQDPLKKDKLGSRPIKHATSRSSLPASMKSNAHLPVPEREREIHPLWFSLNFPLIFPVKIFYLFFFLKVFLTWFEGLRAEGVTFVQTVKPSGANYLWVWAIQIKMCLFAYKMNSFQTAIRGQCHKCVVSINCNQANKFNNKPHACWHTGWFMMLLSNFFMSEIIHKQPGYTVVNGTIQRRLN